MFSTTRFFSCSKPATRVFTITKPYRTFSTFTSLNMPEALTQQEVDKHTDPSVSKQYDDSVSSEEKFEDFYKIVDGLKIGMMGTLRNGIGVGSSSDPATWQPHH